jgi:hypothetical protein
MSTEPVVLLINDDADPIVRSGEQTITEIPALLSSAPHLTDPAHAVEAAQVINHLSEGYDFQVIEDPDAFRKSYLDKLAAGQGGSWQQGQTQLRDFGKADLDQIAAPVSDAKGVTFFARDTYTGFPYKVRAMFDGSKPSYDPVPAGPL